MSDGRDDENATPKRRSRSWDSGASTGQERTVSYESEERYWTDYLRVALPVIGLLLMLALFWWWAQQFIGDDGNEGDLASATQTAIATIAPPTPTNTVEVVVQPTTGSEDATEDPDQTPSDDATEETVDCDGDFAKGDLVVITEDGVNLREDPEVVDGNVISQLDGGTTVSIVSECYEEDDAGNLFWRVRNSETADTGWVSAAFLETAPDE